MAGTPAPSLVLALAVLAATAAVAQAQGVCPASQYLVPGGSSCLPCRACRIPTQFVRAPCTASSDAVCEMVTTCYRGNETVPPTATSDRVCLDTVVLEFPESLTPMLVPLITFSQSVSEQSDFRAEVLDALRVINVDTAGVELIVSSREGKPIVILSSRDLSDLDKLENRVTESTFLVRHAGLIYVPVLLAQQQANKGGSDESGGLLGLQATVFYILVVTVALLVLICALLLVIAVKRSSGSRSMLVTPVRIAYANPSANDRPAAPQGNFDNPLFNAPGSRSGGMDLAGPSWAGETAVDEIDLSFAATPPDNGVASASIPPPAQPPAQPKRRKKTKHKLKEYRRQAPLDSITEAPEEEPAEGEEQAAEAEQALTSAAEAVILGQSVPGVQRANPLFAMLSSGEITESDLREGEGIEEPYAEPTHAGRVRLATGRESPSGVYQEPQYAGGMRLDQDPFAPTSPTPAGSPQRPTGGAANETYGTVLMVPKRPADQPAAAPPRGQPVELTAGLYQESAYAGAARLQPRSPSRSKPQESTADKRGPRRSSSARGAPSSSSRPGPVARSASAKARNRPPAASSPATITTAEATASGQQGAAVRRRNSAPLHGTKGSRSPDRKKKSFFRRPLQQAAQRGLPALPPSNGLVDGPALRDKR